MATAAWTTCLLQQQQRRRQPSQGEGYQSTPLCVGGACVRVCVSLFFRLALAHGARAWCAPCVQGECATSCVSLTGFVSSCSVRAAQRPYPCTSCQRMAVQRGGGCAAHQPMSQHWSWHTPTGAEGSRPSAPPASPPSQRVMCTCVRVSTFVIVVSWVVMPSQEQHGRPDAARPPRDATRPRPLPAAPGPGGRATTSIHARHRGVAQ